MSQIKGGKVVYIGLEAGEKVCMNSDSKGDDVDLTEELVNLYLDSDLEGEDGDVQSSEDTNSESDQVERDKFLLLWKVRTQVCLSPNKNV